MTTAPENPFAAADVGVLYARGRPYHHPRTLERILGIVGGGRVECAIDVACGTGMSTVALTAHAAAVVGVDASPEMLRAAPPAPGVSYMLANAERLPFAASIVDAVTCCSGIHWFDQPSFFGELRRVLRGDAWIALYDHYFLGEMVDVPEFKKWAGDMLRRFPLPARNPQVGDPRVDTPAGFVHVADDLWVDEVEMTPDSFADYMLTISNFVAAAERGTPRGELREWLVTSIKPLFGGEPTRVVRFLGSLTCLRLVAGEEPSVP